MKKEIVNIEGKTVTLYLCDREDAPVVFSNDFTENDAETVLSECRQMGCTAFHLVSITGLRWDEDLSPWQCDSVVSKEDHFTGEADAYLKLLEETIVPYIKKKIPNSNLFILNGYSMGGLFALYAAHRSTCFTAYIAPSASVWYPHFVEYVCEHSFQNIPKCIYLSLGDKESRTKNIYLSETENKMKQLQDIYNQKHIPVCFVLNPGNHFKNPANRIAKGIVWTIEQLEMNQ